MKLTLIILLLIEAAMAEGFKCRSPKGQYEIIATRDFQYDNMLSGLGLDWEAKLTGAYRVIRIRNAKNSDYLLFSNHDLTIFPEDVNHYTEDKKLVLQNAAWELKVKESSLQEANKDNRILHRIGDVHDDFFTKLSRLTTEDEGSIDLEIVDVERPDVKTEDETVDDMERDIGKVRHIKFKRNVSSLNPWTIKQFPNGKEVLKLMLDPKKNTINFSSETDWHSGYSNGKTTFNALLTYPKLKINQAKVVCTEDWFAI